MTGDLEGHVVVVTGATGGLGLAIAERCASAGAHVAITSRDLGRAARAAASVGEDAAGFVLDGDSAEVTGRVVEEVLDRWGRLDGLVNNSGAAIDGYITRIADERWAEALSVNLTTPFAMLRAVVPEMKRAARGAVVNMVSWAGLHGNTGQVGYSSAKAGLVGLTFTAAKELGQFGIRVNAVSPSVYPTRMTAGIAPEQRAAMLAGRPLPHEGTPAQVAEAVLFLLSDRSSHTTGQVLHVDGGLHLG